MVGIILLMCTYMYLYTSLQSSCGTSYVSDNALEFNCTDTVHFVLLKIVYKI